MNISTFTKNMINQTIKSLITRWGYVIYPKKRLPFGCDLALDINRITPNTTIKTVFDVGANKGQSALYYRKNFIEADIFCFEPVKTTFNYLQTKTSLDKHIFCFNLALGESIGEGKIAVKGTSGSNSLKNHKNLTDEHSLEKIKITTLDNFLVNTEKPIDHIDLLKIDTEGYECQVLRGAQNSLQQEKILYILIEVTFREEDPQHTKFSEIQSLLSQYNFHLMGFYDLYPYWGGGNAIDYANALFKRWEPGKNLRLWE